MDGTDAFELEEELLPERVAEDAEVELPVFDGELLVVLPIDEVFETVPVLVEAGLIDFVPLGELLVTPGAAEDEVD